MSMAMPEANSIGLKREHVRCALCGGDNTTVKFKINTQGLQLASVWVNGVQHQVPGTETIVVCKICGLVYVNPRLASMPGLVPYSAEQEMEYFKSSREIRLLAYQALLKQIPDWLGREAKSLLDVGCGDGMLVEAAREEGIESVGAEISEPLIRLVQERLGQDAILSTDLAQLPQACYDVITLINVIEHLPHPDEMLGNAARLLEPGGILLVHTPNLGGLPARVSGVRWHQVEPFGHLYYFNAATLGRLLQRCGFEPVGRFNLTISKGVKGMAHRFLGKMGIYLDNGLGIVARRAKSLVSLTGAPICPP